MESAEIIARLKALEPQLRARGMEALYLFGSAARGEAGPASDIDLMCDIKQSAPLDLFDFFSFERDLAACLKVSVDLCERKALFPMVKQRAEKEMVRVF
jgi:uncharacterized protein